MGLKVGNNHLKWQKKIIILVFQVAEIKPDNNLSFILSPVMSFLALRDISMCSEWKKGLMEINSVIEHPSWLQEGQSAHKGWIWAGPFWTHWDKTALERDNWVAAASHAPEIWEKNALILPKSAIQKAARGTGTVFKESIHMEGTIPQALH